MKEINNSGVVKQDVETVPFKISERKAVHSIFFEIVFDKSHERNMASRLGITVKRKCLA
jgi:RNase P protein component